MMTRSLAVVQGLVARRPSVQTKKFARAVSALFPDEKELRECARAIVPDAYEIHHDIDTVTILEVVDTHPID